MRGLKTHRKMRERAILERIRGGDRTIADMVKAIYSDTDPRLHGAAGLSVLAHLEDLVARGLVATDGDPAIDGIFAPVALKIGWNVLPVEATSNRGKRIPDWPEVVPRSPARPARLSWTGSATRRPAAISGDCGPYSR